MLLLWTIEGCPDGLSLEETHRMTQSTAVAREAMINTFWQSHEIPLLDVNADPLIVQVADIKVSTSTQDVTNFFRVVNVFCFERKSFNGVEYSIMNMVGLD